MLSQLQNCGSKWIFDCNSCWLLHGLLHCSPLHQRSITQAESWWRSSRRGLETHSWASQRASWLCRPCLPYAAPYCLQSGTPLSLSTCIAHLHCPIVHAGLQRQASLWPLPLPRDLHQQCCKSSVWLHMSACTSHHSCLQTSSSCLQLFSDLSHQRLWWFALHCFPLLLELMQFPLTSLKFTGSWYLHPASSCSAKMTFWLTALPQMGTWSDIVMQRFFLALITSAGLETNPDSSKAASLAAPINQWALTFDSMGDSLCDSSFCM